MFKASKAKKEDTPAIPSMIGPDLHIVGALSTEGAIRVDGVVDGDIKCAMLDVGVDGVVNGDVDAKVIRVEGAVNGVVTAGAVYLMSTARMRGDVIHAKLSVEGGAVVEGNFRQRDASDASIEARLHTAPASDDQRAVHEAADHRNAVAGGAVLQGPHAPQSR
ncbi:MAG: polymer-forming cytoskeletal protein [Alphaproteobacteria bacterium]|nr:polymer-forming cytoskeletal protein [Alphaproteobacteria bacterium]